MCHEYGRFFDTWGSGVISRETVSNSAIYRYKWGFWLCFTNKINRKNDRTEDW